MKRIALAFYFIAALAAGGIAYAAEPSLAPNFALKGMDGTNVRLSEARGQVVMINFWATWCGPCRQEMPVLNDLYKRYRSAGFLLLGINTERKPEEARAMATKLGIEFPILFDTDKTASRAYEVAAMPYTVLVDRSGKIRYRHRGYVPGTEREYETQIRELLKE